MKKLTIIIVLLFVNSIVFAQKDLKAQKILDQLSSKTKSHKVIEAKFSIDFKNTKENIQNTSEGNIIMKGNMYHLKFLETESFFDGKTLWNYIKSANEVNISEPEPNNEDILSNPKQLFTIYENNYKYQLISEFYEKNKQYSLIDLYPYNLDEEYSRIRLQINTKNYTISSATIFGKDGSFYIVKLFDYKFDKSLPDSYFKFDQSTYKDLEIVDMRL